MERGTVHSTSQDIYRSGERQYTALVRISAGVERGTVHSNSQDISRSGERHSTQH